MKKEGGPRISAEHPHSQETLHLTRREEHYASSVFCLFSGEIQYGVLVTEIPPEKISLFASHQPPDWKHAPAAPDVGRTAEAAEKAGGPGGRGGRKE